MSGDQPRPRIVVVGSTNMDLVVTCPSIPRPGETVLGGQFVTISGGKGANQAVAAARLGAEVTFVGSFGADSFGMETRRQLVGEGIDLTFSRQDEFSPHGVALILVDALGENAIAVAPGANLRLTPDDIRRAETAIRGADVLLLQLEVDLATVSETLRVAEAAGVPVILNPAPFRTLSSTDLGRVAYLVANESEAAGLLRELDLMAPDRQVRQLLELGPKNALITIGSGGVWWATADAVAHQPALPVTATDTTAAGDAFCGGLAVGLAAGWELPAAVQLGNQVAGFSVTRPGAQSSLPTLGELNWFLRERGSGSQPGETARDGGATT